MTALWSACRPVSYTHLLDLGVLDGVLGTVGGHDDGLAAVELVQRGVVCLLYTSVTVRVNGAGVLVGLDNGDSADPDEYQTDSRRLFSGMLLAVVAGLSLIHI